MSIEPHELLRRLIATVPPLHGPLVTSVQDWFFEDGTISYFQVCNVLRAVIVEHFDKGDYSFSDELFLVIEELLEHGSQETQAIIATGLLEGLQHQERLHGKLWAPLLGPRARAHCQAMDEFHGCKTPGLYDAS